MGMFKSGNRASPLQDSPEWPAQDEYAFRQTPLPGKWVARGCGNQEQDTLAGRVDELIEKLLDNELTVAERDELETYRESNASAKKLIEDAEAHLRSVAEEPRADMSRDLVDANSEDAKHRHRTPMSIRILAAVLLLAIVFGFVMLPFVRFEASMMEVQRGKVLTPTGNPLGALRDDGVAVVEKGEVAELEIRGRSKMLVTGPARLEFTEKGPAARINVAHGTVELERMQGHRECFLAVGALEAEPQESGGAMRLVKREGSNAFMLTMVSGSARVLVGGKPVEAAGVKDGLVSGAGTQVYVGEHGEVRVVTGEQAAGQGLAQRRPADPVTLP